MQTDHPVLTPGDRRRRFRMVVPAYPAFNVYSAVARRTTALGPLLIATIVNKLPGWDVEVIDENNYRRYGPRDALGLPDHEILQRIRPADAVGFYGGLTSTIPRLCQVAQWYHAAGVTTMAGGQHFAGCTILEGLQSGLDYIAIGEGEETIRDLLASLELGHDPAGTAGVACLRDGQVVCGPAREPLTDFARVPCPEFSLLRHARLKLYPLAWVRGCGMHCEFCTVKGRVRCPAPEYVMAQISALYEQRGARLFFLVDDLFGQNRTEALRLCRMLADYQRAMHVRFDITVQIRLDKGGDAELLAAMRQAGIMLVAIGFESPVPEELAAMNKHVHPEEMITLARNYHRAGFLVHGMFIFGYPQLPGQTLNLPLGRRVACFRRFIRQARIDTVQVLLPVPLPGTELTERLAAQHRLYPRELVGWEYYDGNFPLFEPDPPLKAEDLQRGAFRIMGRFYRFWHLFAVGLDVLIFPSLVLWLHDLRFGWSWWYRNWHDHLMRFGGWVIVRRWTAQFRTGGFAQRLAAVRAARLSESSDTGQN